MYFLYRFLDKNNNIIYVGRTNKPLIDRINSHTHLPNKCYQERQKIEYTTCKDKPTLVIYELYYINKWKPKYNVVQRYEEEMALQLPELRWRVYNPRDFQTNKKLKNKKSYGIDVREKTICTNKKVWNDFKNVINKYPKKTIEEFIELEESGEIKNLLPPNMENFIEYRGKDYENNSKDLNRLTLCFGLTYTLKNVSRRKKCKFLV